MGPRSYLAPISIRTGWHNRGKAALGLYLCPWPQYGLSGRLISITRLPRASTCALRSHKFIFLASPTLAFCDSALVLSQPYPNLSNIYELEMDGLNSLLIKLDIRPPPFQVRESQGSQNFHQFPELPPEIREKIWKFSFPDARSIRVCPIVPKDGHLSLPVHGNKPQRVLVKFSYEDDNPIMALKTSRESRGIALSVYKCFIEHPRGLELEGDEEDLDLPLGGKITYFCPDRDTLLFAGLEEVFMMLLLSGERPGSVTQLLTNTFDHEASQITDQFADSSTTIKWSSILENTTSYVWGQGRPMTTYRLQPPRSGSIPSKFLRQASTSHHRVRFNVRDAFLERYGLTLYCRRGVRRRKRSGKVRGILG
jgi:hypothetical protein